MKQLVALLGVAAMATQAWAVVLHVDATPTDKPADAVVGRWGSSTTCVAVGRQWVLASTHQGGAPGTKVTLGGSTYVVTEVHDSGYDVRLARLARLDGSQADLADHVALSRDPVSPVGRRVLFAGYGRSRGTPLVNADGVVYGYLWGSSGVLRWGTNTVDAMYSNFLCADFDPPPAKTLLLSKTSKDIRTTTEHEAALAAGDSGGGWFARHPETQQWEIIGVSVSVSRDGASWFSPPDGLYAVKTSIVANWAEAIMAAAELPPPLAVSAATNYLWVYENAPLTTLNRHAVVLTLAVTDDPGGNTAYDVTVEQVAGSGQVVIEPTADPMVWIVRGGEVALAAAGDVVLSAVVRGRDNGAQGLAAATLKVRRLGDVDANGGVEPTDLSAMVNCLNGMPPEPHDPRAYDLNGDGGAEPSDMAILINILNGLTPQ
jgi:hypothetical protein